MLVIFVMRSESHASDQTLKPATERLHGINGGISGSPTSGSRVLVYAAVPSIPPVLAKIKSLGGKIVMPRMDVGPVVMGLYEDPEGNTMGLIEA